MEDPFKGISPAKDDDFDYENHFRYLTDSYVFCPKCGMQNTFTLSRTGAELIYFCRRCSEKLTDLWKGVRSGKLYVANCDSCRQLTFAELKYCI